MPGGSAATISRAEDRHQPTIHQPAKRHARAARAPGRHRRRRAGQARRALSGRDSASWVTLLCRKTACPVETPRRKPWRPSGNRHGGWPRRCAAVAGAGPEQLRPAIRPAKRACGRMVRPARACRVTRAMLRLTWPACRQTCGSIAQLCWPTSRRSQLRARRPTPWRRTPKRRRQAARLEGQRVLWA